MFKKLRLLLTLLIVSLTFVIGAMATTTTAYVKSGASGTGLTSSSPIGSITDAFGLFGSDGGEMINELASLAHTINYEVVCRISKRVIRELVE